MVPDEDMYRGFSPLSLAFISGIVRSPGCLRGLPGFLALDTRNPAFAAEQLHVYSPNEVIGNYDDIYVTRRLTSSSRFAEDAEKVQALQKIEWLQGMLRQLDFGMPFYTLVYIAAIIFFCYFYVSIIFNPVDVADNIKKYGGFIPGKRPGKPTAEYIDTVLTRITLGGALYLAAICILPMFLLGGTNVHLLPIIGPYLEGVLPKFVLTGFGVPFYFGGTSLLIVVGVTMDTVQQIESQLIMRHYEGFLKGSLIGGRRR